MDLKAYFLSYFLNCLLLGLAYCVACSPTPVFELLAESE